VSTKVAFDTLFDTLAIEDALTNRIRMHQLDLGRWTKNLWQGTRNPCSACEPTYPEGLASDGYLTGRACVLKNCQITSVATMSLFVCGSSHELPGQLWPPFLIR
jgi:hypothetical protein